MTDETCRNCSGVGWVCENHADRPWGGMSSDPLACDCGAGMPCGACNLEDASAGYVCQATQALQSKLDRATDALEKARDQFDFYARSHRDKGTEDGDRKAATNQTWVDDIDAALAAIKDQTNA